MAKTLQKLTSDDVLAVLEASGINHLKRDLLQQLFHHELRQEKRAEAPSAASQTDSNGVSSSTDVHSSNLLMHFETFEHLFGQLGVHEHGYCKSYFYAIDRMHRGGLSEEDFVLGLAMMFPETPHELGDNLSSNKPGDIRCRYIFRMYDVNHDDRIDVEEFRNMLRHIRRSKGLSIDEKDLEDALTNEARQFVDQEGNYLSCANFIRSVQAKASGSQGFAGTEVLFRLKASLPWERLEQLRTSSSQTVSPPATPSPLQSTLSHHSVAVAHTITPNRRRATIRVRACFVDTEKRRSVNAQWRREASKRIYKPSASIVILDDEEARVPPAVQIARKCQEYLLMEHNERKVKTAQYPEADKCFSSPLGASWPLAPPFTLLSHQEWLELCHQVSSLILSEDCLVRVPAPVKVFGDIHGQLDNLMEYFDHYGSPNRSSGDIEYIRYVFIGDYVDRGTHSLEVVCLLFSLKILYPTRVCLLRGNHEDRSVNAQYGFLQECKSRLSPPEFGEQIWNLVNEVFDAMPLAALISDRILCVHGGIGESVNTFEDITKIPRPLKDPKSHPVSRCLLWSDPTESDLVLGVHENSRGGGIVKFGPDRVLEFCAKNDIDMIFRAHEVVETGFELFAGGHLITVFSATNYCARFQNDGAILLVTDELEVVPKIINAKPPQQVQPCWQIGLLQERPPTPPRPRVPYLLG